MIDYDFVEPNKEWRFIIHADVKKTGCGDCGLFVEAETEKQAEKYLKNLIEILKKEELEELD